MRMKKYLGTIFLIFGFLEIIVLSAISTFDRVMYEDTNHFIGFINNYGLWHTFFKYRYPSFSSCAASSIPEIL